MCCSHRVLLHCVCKLSGAVAAKCCRLRRVCGAASWSAAGLQRDWVRQATEHLLPILQNMATILSKMQEAERETEHLRADVV